jgi:RimJ/RimL family protein N-acetyltransferase
MLPPEIETRRLRLRAFTAEDLDGLHLVFGDAEVMRFISGGKARSREETEIGLGRTIEGWRTRGFGFWAVTSLDSTGLIGYCGFMFLENTPEVEIAYGLKKSHWGRGFATEAARACLRCGFEELKLARIVAVVHPQNVASQRVLEKLGMTYAKRVHHYDAELMYYEISKSDYSPKDSPYSLRPAANHG